MSVVYEEGNVSVSVSVRGRGRRNVSREEREEKGIQPKHREIL